MTQGLHSRRFSRAFTAMAMFLLLWAPQVAALMAAGGACGNTCCRTKKKGCCCRTTASGGPAVSARVCPSGCGQTASVADPIFVWGAAPLTLAVVNVFLAAPHAMMLGLLVLSLFAQLQRPPPQFAIRFF